MKTVILGTLFVLAILGALYVVTEGSKPSTSTMQSQPASNPNDSNFKDLKIQ